MISNFILEINLMAGCAEENSFLTDVYLLLCSLNSLLVCIVVCSICCNSFSGFFVPFHFSVCLV